MYTIAETSAYMRLFEYIRSEIIGSPSVVQMTDLTSKSVSFMNELEISNIKANTKKHIRRKIETEFASSLSFISTRQGKLLVLPDNLSREKLAKQYINLKGKYDALCKEDDGIEKVSLKVALRFYNEIKDTCKDQAWPPFPEELNVMRCSQYCKNSLAICMQPDPQFVRWTNFATNCGEQRMEQWNPVNCLHVRTV